MGEKRGGHGGNTAVTDSPQAGRLPGCERIECAIRHSSDKRCVVLQGRGASATTLQPDRMQPFHHGGAKRSLCLSSRGVMVLHTVVRGQPAAAGRPLMGQSAH